MIGLVRHIEYLLLHNDDVFIPGLGRFTVLCDEAKIQSGGTSFLPPVRKVAFESVATGDSGLLVVRLCVPVLFLGTSGEAIAEEVELFINTWSKVRLWFRAVGTIGLSRW